MRRNNTIKAFALAMFIIAGSVFVSGHGDNWVSYSIETPPVTVSLLDDAIHPEV